MTLLIDQQPNAESVRRKGLLAVCVSEGDGCCVVAPKGELDNSTADLLDAAIREAQAGAPQQLVLDLRDLTFMNSSGLRLILQAHARSRADSTRLRVVPGPNRVQRVFEITGMDTQLPFSARA